MQYTHTLSAYVSASELEAVLFPWLVTTGYTLKHVLAVPIFLHLYVEYYPIFSMIKKIAQS